MIPLFSLIITLILQGMPNLITNWLAIREYLRKFKFRARVRLIRILQY